MKSQRKVLILVAIVLVAVAYRIPGQAAPNDPKSTVSAEAYYDGESAYWTNLRHYVQDMNTIRVGMTRGDLKKTFHEAGGLHQFQWVYNRSPHVVMDVHFDTDLLLSNDSEEKITSLGKPYWNNDGRANPN